MSRSFALFASVLFVLVACAGESGFAQSSRTPSTHAATRPPTGQAVATFAGGCFWCMESSLEAIPGVREVLSGYTGGRLAGPSYEEVSSGRTHHMESVRVIYDPQQIDYAHLLDVFWHNVDPTQNDGQFCDRGGQYRTAIFVANAEERRLAEASKARIPHELGHPVVTEIRDAGPFWIAEDYHQNYYRTNPDPYHRYRLGCGRDARLDQLWGAHAGH